MMPLVLLSALSLAMADVASSPLGGVFGVQAIFLHTNQLAVPVLFGWRLRDHLNSALASEVQRPHHGASGVVPTVPSTGSVLLSTAPPSPLILRASSSRPSLLMVLL